jgi:hypothetical protein
MRRRPPEDEESAVAATNIARIRQLVDGGRVERSYDLADHEGTKRHMSQASA